MRFFLATVLFILAISLVLLGLAQRTIWAPPSEYGINLNSDSSSPYVVIGPGQLALLPGDVRVTAVGVDSVFLAEGLKEDVLAWIADSPHQVAVISDEGEGIELTEVLGSGDLASPLGSDLWKSEVVGQGFSELTVAAESNRAVIIASDGFDPAPGAIRISWPIESSTVVSDIFMSVGFGLMVLAIILNLLALRKMIINRGPRRKLPRAPQGPKYRPRKSSPQVPRRGRRSARAKLAASSLGLILSFSLAGCAMSPTPTPIASPTESPSEPAVEVIPPVVDEVQLKRILNQISSLVAIADEDRDAELLAERVAGPALRFREAQYLLMTKSEDIAPPEPISTSVLTISLPASTNLWPRSVMAVTEGSNSLPQMLVLQQQSPRDLYKLWYSIPLLPGSEIPAVPAPEIGSIPVEQDSLFLRVSPNQLVATFGDVIDNGSLSQYYSLFDLSGDEFYEQISTSQKEQIEKLKRADITISHNLGDPNIIALSTSDSGALVALMMTDNYVIRPNRDNAAVTVSGLEEILLGVEGSTTGVRTVYGDMLLFYVPSSTSNERVVLLGATQSLLSIRIL